MDPVPATSLNAQDMPALSRSAPTKLTPPAMGAPFLARERLTAWVRQAPDAKLVCVQAPAGFGKTTLLRHLYDTFRADGWTVAWLTLDANDNDLDRFMTCLGEAFARLKRVSAATARGDLHIVRRREAEDFELGRSIAATPMPFMLVLDEFEHLHNPAVLSVVQQLVELLGPQQKLVLASREQPALSLARLRARHQLLEIDAAQLRFSLEEADQFLRDKRRLPLDVHDVERLHELTGGWAAALWLSSLALENSDNPKRFIGNFSGSHTVVSSYLAEDVLSHQPPLLQDFILQTSILHKFCADSCNAVTGRSDSAALIAEIERSNMLISALDQQRTWFSYHPLLAGFLRNQLQRQQPALVTTLHRRAARWYIGEQRPTPAIDHALAAGDQELALQLLDRHAEALFLQGRVRLLARWFDTLGTARLVAHPKLISVYTWALIHINRSAEALGLLEALNSHAALSPLSQSSYHVLKVFSLMMLDRTGQTAPLWEDPSILGSAAQKPLLRSMLMIGCAYYHAVSGRYRQARLLLDKATQEHGAVGPLFSVAVAGYMHGMLDLMQGQLRAAGARLRAVIGDDGQARAHGVAPRLRVLLDMEAGAPGTRYGAQSGFASLYLAEVLYETDALAEAKRLLKMYLPLVKEAGIPDQLIATHLVYARILRAEGHAHEAIQVLLDMEQLGMQRSLPRIVDMARLERARAAVLEGDLEAARAIFALVGSAPAWQEPGLQMVANDIETPALGAFRLQVHGGQAAAALPLLKEHLQDAHARGRPRYALRVKVLYALALSLAGQRNPALRTMRDTVQEAQHEGFVRVFKDEGPALLALVREMLEGMKDSAGPEHAAVRKFAGRMLAVPPVAIPLHAAGEAPAPESELTARELDVLRLLAQGCGNQLIAEKLFVSVTTVKTHLRNINLKLGAHNRTEAISIARRLGIAL